MKRIVSLLLLALLSAPFAACSGGGAVPGASRSVAAPPAHRRHVKLRIHIKIPTCLPERRERDRKGRCPALSHGRRPRYISPATQSIALTFTSTDNPGNDYSTSANLTPTASGCSSTLASTQCTLTVSLAPDAYTAQVTTYDQTGEAGNQLSAADVGVTVNTGEDNNLAIALSGIPASTIVVPIDSLTRLNGTGYDLLGQGAHHFIAESLDADGNIIAGAGSPLFTIGTPSGALSGVTVSTSQTSAAAPNTFTVTPPTSYQAGTASFAVTPTFSGQATDGCAQSGANCAAVTVTVDMQPLIYVVNGPNSTIGVYDQSGNQVTVPGGFPHLSKPAHLAYDPNNGWFYVANCGNSTVTAYDENGNQQTLAGGFPNLFQPIGITFDPTDDWFFVANIYNGTVTVYDQSGNQVMASTVFANLDGPFGIVYDEGSQFVYVVNSADSKVNAYNVSGVQQTLEGSFVGLGFPTAIAYDSHNSWLYVTNSESGTVTAYSDQGESESPTGGFSGIDGPQGIVYDPVNDWLYVTNGANSTVTAYDESGNQQTLSGGFPNLDAPFGIAYLP